MFGNTMRSHVDPRSINISMTTPVEASAAAASVVSDGKVGGGAELSIIGNMVSCVPRSIDVALASCRASNGPPVTRSGSHVSGGVLSAANDSSSIENVEYRPPLERPPLDPFPLPYGRPPLEYERPPLDCRPRPPPRGAGEYDVKVRGTVGRPCFRFQASRIFCCS